jgi:hypothetical protein
MSKSRTSVNPKAVCRPSPGIGACAVRGGAMEGGRVAVSVIDES